MKKKNWFSPFSILHFRVSGGRGRAPHGLWPLRVWLLGWEEALAEGELGLAGSRMEILQDNEVSTSAKTAHVQNTQIQLDTWTESTHLQPWRKDSGRLLRSQGLLVQSEAFPWPDSSAKSPNVPLLWQLQQEGQVLVFLTKLHQFFQIFFRMMFNRENIRADKEVEP